MSSLVMLIILFIIFLLIKISFLKPSPSDTPAGAIVMACGIFINGAMKNIPSLEKNAGRFSAAVLFLLWLFIWLSFALSYIKKDFRDLHLKNAVKSFAMGTWVAGTSVCGIAVFQRLSGLKFLAYPLFYIAVGIWIYYLAVIWRGYGRIFKQGLQNKVHGVLLLSTVSTQSLVVIGSTIYYGNVLIYLSRFLIVLGIIFYIAAFVLIMRRYLPTGGWKVEDDWFNTNCIIHGAMSITGLASVASGAVSSFLILLIWLWVLAWFVIVEAIELYRAYRRIKKYGFKKGIAVYDITQWSRIFTFGMLYTFTMRFDVKNAAGSSGLLLNIKQFILESGTWVMVIILLIEGILFFTYNSKFYDSVGRKA